MNLTIVLYEPYPNGMACTNRIHYYAKGINESGGHANIIIPRPSEHDGASARNHDYIGQYEGVRYEYTCGTVMRPGSFIKRRLTNTKGLLVAALNVYRNRHESDAILIVTNILLPIIIFAMVAKISRLKYIQEKSELPFYHKHPKNVLQKLYQETYKKYLYKLFDGIIAISRPLLEFFGPRIRPNAELLLVPVLVDPDEFENGHKNTQDPYIAYCGNFTQQQDGILTLIKAFKEVSEKNVNIQLRLIGEPLRQEDKQKVIDLIDELKLDKRIDMDGYVTRPQLIMLIKSAKALVLAKPRSKQADYCFPSKLAEYLISGNPVIVTRVGVISDYLSDLDTAFLAEPDSVDSLALKIIEALNNENLASDVGDRGRKVALDNFAYHAQVGRIIKFIEKLPV